MSDILTGTPPSLTYLHSAVQDAWAVVWVIVASGLGVLLAWAGISIIFREHLGSQSGWRELAPRLMLGVVAASTSLWWSSFVIDLADSISRFVAVSLGVTINDLLRAPLDVLLNATVLGNVGAPGARSCGTGAVDTARHGGLGPPLAADVPGDTWVLRVCRRRPQRRPRPVLSCSGPVP